MKRVTIQNIAMELGLSRNTVAKALNGGVVSPSTKQAVVQKAWQMGYAKLAPGLIDEVQTIHRRASKGTILVLFNHWQSTFWNRTLTGISTAVNDKGCRMQLHVVDEEDYDGDNTYRLIANDVKGIIFLGLFPVEFVRGVSRAGVPMTFFNSPVHAQEYIKLGDVVYVDGFYAMDKLTDYVIRNKGCSSLMYIGYAEGSYMVHSRYMGFLNACSRNHIAIDEKMQFTVPTNHNYFSYAMVDEVMNELPSIPDAIICEDDDVAKNVMFALLRRAPKMAEGPIITGFNNTIEPDFFHKEILTVEVRMEELGKRLVKSVMDRINNPEMDIACTTIAAYPKIDI